MMISEFTEEQIFHIDFVDSIRRAEKIHRQSGRFERADFIRQLADAFEAAGHLGCPLPCEYPREPPPEFGLGQFADRFY